MKIAYEFHDSSALIIAIANALSTEIDRLAADGMREEAVAKMKSHFNAACNILEARGVVVSDVVVCPHA